MQGELKHFILFHQTKHLTQKRSCCIYVTHPAGATGGDSVIYTYTPTDLVFGLLTTLNTHRSPYTIGGTHLQSVTFIHQYAHFYYIILYHIN